MAGNVVFKLSFAKMLEIVAHRFGLDIDKSPGNYCIYCRFGLDRNKKCEKKVGNYCTKSLV